MTALIFTILAGAFAIGAFVCACTERPVRNARMMRDEYRGIRK